MHIFDMDGTLIDSNGIWREVDEAFLAKRGFPYTKEYYQGVAHTIFPLAAEFTKRYCHLEESVEDIMAEWMEMAGAAGGLGLADGVVGEVIVVHIALFGLFPDGVELLGGGKRVKRTNGEHLRLAAGLPPLVTPTSQIVGAQAVN